MWVEGIFSSRGIAKLSGRYDILVGAIMVVLVFQFRTEMNEETKT